MIFARGIAICSASSFVKQKYLPLSEAPKIEDTVIKRFVICSALKEGLFFEFVFLRFLFAFLTVFSGSGTTGSFTEANPEMIFSSVPAVSFPAVSVPAVSVPAVFLLPLLPVLLVSVFELFSGSVPF